jgi:hypothetical protein
MLGVGIANVGEPCGVILQAKDVQRDSELLT